MIGKVLFFLRACCGPGSFSKEENEVLKVIDLIKIKKEIKIRITCSSLLHRELSEL